MTDKRSAYDRSVVDLQLAEVRLHDAISKQDASAEEIYHATVEKRKIEVRLVAARLAQAEYYLDALQARLDFLEARAARDGGATKREQAELEWARGAVPANAATVARLAEELEWRKQELEELTALTPIAKDAAA